MVTAIIKEKQIAETITGDAAIAIAISEELNDTSNVEIIIIGDISPMQAASILGCVIAEILKDFANDAEIPEPVLSAVFARRFLKKREENDETAI